MGGPEGVSKGGKAPFGKFFLIYRLIKTIREESKMPLTEKEWLNRDVKRNIGEELLQAVREMNNRKYGHRHLVERSPVVTANQESSTDGDLPPP